MKMYKMDGMPGMPTDMTLIINTNSTLIKKLSETASSDEAKAEKIAKQIYTLSLIAQRQLTAEELRSFLDESFDMLLDI